MPDLIESQIRAGLEPEARSTLAEFEAQAQRTGRALGARRRRALPRSARPAGDRRRGLRRGAPARRALPSPFERARTELCWGERLRRDGRRVEARRHLHDAHRALRSARRRALGREGRARTALQRRPRPARAARPQRRADAQQMQIATMVAEGRTNKSIANSLFLSPKTIEFHLGHVYRKLDVSNRTAARPRAADALRGPNALGIPRRESPRRRGRESRLISMSREETA